MTTASYAPQAARALSTLARKGASVTFTLRTPGTLDPATNTRTASSVSTVAGYAVQDNPALRVYQALGLVATDARTLQFSGSTAGEVPPLGASCSWGGVTYTVRDVSPVAPSGTAVIVRVVVAK